jgi:hypothetical protein
MSRSHRHHHAGHHAGIHRDKVRQRWKILILLVVGLVIIVFFIRLSWPA